MAAEMKKKSVAEIYGRDPKGLEPEEICTDTSFHSESAIVDFDLLPLGSRFKYLTGGKLYVKISYKIVAVFSDVLGDRLQEVFSAFSPFESDHMVEWIK